MVEATTHSRHPSKEGRAELLYQLELGLEKTTPGTPSWEALVDFISLHEARGNGIYGSLGQRISDLPQSHWERLISDNNVEAARVQHSIDCKRIEDNGYREVSEQWRGLIDPLLSLVSATTMAELRLSPHVDTSRLTEKEILAIKVGQARAGLAASFVVGGKLRRLVQARENIWKRGQGQMAGRK